MPNHEGFVAIQMYEGATYQALHGGTHDKAWDPTGDWFRVRLSLVSTQPVLCLVPLASFLLATSKPSHFRELTGVNGVRGVMEI